MAEQTKRKIQDSTTSSAGRIDTSPIPKPSLTANESFAGERAGNIGNGGLMQQVRTTAGDAFDTATSKASEKLEEQKSNLSTGLTSVASGIRDLGNRLGDPGSDNHFARIASEASTTAAKKIERAADYFDQHDLNAVYKDVENFARRNPAVVLGSAFALGFLAARFLKSNNPKRLRAAAGQPFNTPPQNRPRMGGEAARGL